MGRDPWSDLSIHISRRTWRCIADARVCLSHDGAAFIAGLTQHAEIWLPAEWLAILDTALLYDREPEWLAGPHEDVRAHDVRGALRTWSRLRDLAGQGGGTLAGGRLFWVRDALRESCLPAGMNEDVVARWEILAQTLDERLATAPQSSGPLIAAARDTIALAGVLPGAVVLTRLDPHADPALPRLCADLQAWGVPCRRMDGDDDAVALERVSLLHLLVEAGLIGFLWGGLRLAVLHLVVPSHIMPVGHKLAYEADDADYLEGDVPRPIRGPWEDAQAFWYELKTEDPHGRR